MVHIDESPKKNSPRPRVRLTTGQIRDLAKAFSQMLAVTVSEIPLKVKSLLQYYGVSIGEDHSDQDLINSVIEKVSEQDEEFNTHLEELILIAIPELQTLSGYDNFGGGSSGNKLLDGAKTIGASTAKGAVGGGIVGAALGAIGGIFGFASSAKQEKIEKSKASAMTLSSMFQYKSAKLGSQRSSQKTTTAIIIAIITLVGLIVAAVFFKQNKKAT